MFLEFKSIFFETLDYPEYVRPFFLIKKQKESGWHKGIFLKVLHEIYVECKFRFEIKHNGAKSKNPDIEMSSISIPIKDLKGSNHSGVLKMKQLDEIELAILTAYEIDKEEKIFSDIEIINFTEYALWFIRNEFQIQIGETTNQSFRPRTSTYFTYLIISEAPFIDFPSFKKSVRGVVWKNGSNISVETNLKNFHKAACEIVKIWNEKLFKLEASSRKKGDENLPETVKMEFNHERLKHSWWNDVPQFDIKGPERFLNQDFANFAAQVANFLANEILHLKDTEVTAANKDFVKNFLDGIHEMMNDGARLDFIKSIKNGKSKEEWHFANWFKTWFKSGGYSPELEPPKSDKRIDLRVSHPAIANKIIEFKGWWNNRKVNVVAQIVSYLTEFESDGYIFIIDDTKNGVLKKYQLLISNINTGYINDSWEKICYYPTNYKFYKSRHRVKGEEKELFHFILSVQNI